MAPVVAATEDRRCLPARQCVTLTKAQCGGQVATQVHEHRLTVVAIMGKQALVQGLDDRVEVRAAGYGDELLGTRAPSRAVRLLRRP
jgi:hypothetical protein